MSWIELQSLIGAMVVYQGLQFAINLIFNQTGKLRFNVILALILVCVSLNFLNMLLLNYNVISVNLGPFFGLCYGPLFFFYTKTLIFADYKFDRWKALHFLPSLAGIFIIIFFPNILFLEIGNLIVSATISVCIGAYLFLSYKQVIWFQRNLKNLESDVIAGNLSWLRFLILSIVAILLIVLIEAMVFSFVWLNELTILFLYVFVLIFLNRINNKGLRQPELFAGITSRDLELTREIENKYSSSNLTEDEARQYEERLTQYMRKEKPYLQFELSLDELAQKTDIPSRYLSQVLNERLNQNFFDFVNGYRLERAKNLLLQSDKLRVNEVMYSAGFNSKSTFNHVFKKEVGTTPSEFRNSKGDKI